MLAAYPKQTCKIQFQLLQIFRREDFPGYNFEPCFHLLSEDRLSRGTFRKKGVSHYENMDPKQKQLMLRKIQE